MSGRSRMQLQEHSVLPPTSPAFFSVFLTGDKFVFC